MEGKNSGPVSRRRNNSGDRWRALSLDGREERAHAACLGGPWEKCIASAEVPRRRCAAPAATGSRLSDPDCPQAIREARPARRAENKWFATEGKRGADYSAPVAKALSRGLPGTDGHTIWRKKMVYKDVVRCCAFF